MLSYMNTLKRKRKANVSIRKTKRKKTSKRRKPLHSKKYLRSKKYLHSKKSQRRKTMLFKGKQRRSRRIIKNKKVGGMFGCFPSPVCVEKGCEAIQTLCNCTRTEPEFITKMVKHFGPSIKPCYVQLIKSILDSGTAGVVGAAGVDMFNPNYISYVNSIIITMYNKIKENYSDEEESYLIEVLKDVLVEVINYNSPVPLDTLDTLNNLKNYLQGLKVVKVFNPMSFEKCYESDDSDDSDY